MLLFQTSSENSWTIPQKKVINATETLSLREGTLLFTHNFGKTTRELCFFHTDKIQNLWHDVALELQIMFDGELLILFSRFIMILTRVSCLHNFWVKGAKKKLFLQKWVSQKYQLQVIKTSFTGNVVSFCVFHFCTTLSGSFLFRCSKRKVATMMERCWKNNTFTCWFCAKKNLSWKQNNRK